jgi:hypothetical protein
MKKSLFVFLFTLIGATLFAQSFEGKITYKNSFKSNTPSITDEQFNAMMGTTHEYFIKGGSYKTVSNGEFMQWQQYVNSDNKLYTKMANSEAAYWNDGAINQDEVLKAEINKGVADVLGYQCDEVILTCKSGVQKYYYSSQFPVDASVFAKHKYGNWYEFISRSKSLPLKIVMETPQFLYEGIAVEVKPMQLDKEMFLLPANIETTKSPY